MDESPAPDFSAASQQPARKHGLELPLNPYQISSWILFLFECSVLYVIILPPLSFVLKLVSGIVITVLMLFAFYNAFKAMKIDPTDPKVREEQQARLKGEDYQTELRHFCLICNAHVQPRTKHCGQCNRCVDTFDHHCIWLNNCVGEQNYRYFMKAVVCLLVSTTVKLGFGIYILINYHTFIEDFNKYASEFYGTDGQFAALHHITIASCVINVFLWLLLMKLFTLHIWLHYKGLTTYESIMLAREEKEELAAMRQQRPKKKKKSKTIKQLDEESYIGNSTFSGKSAFQTATTGLHIDLEDSGQEKSRSSRKGKSKGKNKQGTDKKEVSVANFPRTEGKELENKDIEMLGRSESNFRNQERSRIDKEDSSISVAMLNAEPSSFISSAREYKFQESVLEEEEKNDIEVLKHPGLNDTPPKKLEKQEREERSQSTGRKEVNRSIHKSQSKIRGSPEVSRSVNKSQSKGLFASKSKISRVFSSDAEGSFGINRSGSHHVDANPDITDLKTVVLPVKNYKKIDVYSNDRSDSSWSPLTAINASGIQAIHAQMQKDNTEYLKQVSYNTVTGNPVLTQTTLSKMETNVRPESPEAKELAAKMNSVRSSAINLDDPEAGTQSFQSNANQTRKSVSF